MAPKPKLYLHKASGRQFRLSSDGRYWVFLDNGQRVLAQQPSQTPQGPPDAEPPPKGTGAAGSQGDALTSPLTNLHISHGQRASDSSRATGVSEWTGKDRQTGLQSQWEIGPPQTVPDPRRPYNPKFVRSNGAADLEEHGISGSSHGLVSRGFEGYRRSRDPENDFVRFRVVDILLIPPPTSTYSTTTGGSPNREPITRMRRFVILGPGSRGGFEALPVKTYNGKGCGAANVVKSHHTIIYTGEQTPEPMSAERPQRLSNNQFESGMRQQAIKVKVYDRGTALDPKSRLDFFDLHEFDYNHYFKFFGTVHEDSRPYLIPLFNAVRADLQLSTYQTAPPSAKSVPSNIPVMPQPAPVAESSRAALEAGIKKVTVKLQEFRAFAQKHGYTEPTITTAQLRQYAQNEDAFKQWALQVKAAFQKEQEDAEDETDEEDEDSDEGDDENDESGRT